MFDLEGKKVWVAGHNGMVGKSVVAALAKRNATTLTVEKNVLDLTNQDQVSEWCNDVRPDAVILCAAKVGGILANSTYPADFIYQNLMIQTNVINSAHLAKIQKLLFLGSSCIYPKFANQPIPEEELLSGHLEPTNEWYAIAKISGIKMCQAYRKQYGSDFISLMPTNLFGPYDNFDLDTCHVLPALMQKCHNAKLSDEKFIEVWGTGEPLREFLHVDDCADAIIFLMENYSGTSHVNVGSGQEISIKELAEKMMEIVGFKGHLKFDYSKPDGAPKKLLDTTKLRSLGWKPKISLDNGISQTYAWFNAR